MKENNFGARYQDLLNWSPVGAFQSTIDGKIVVVNKSLSKLLGYSDENEMSGISSMRELYYVENDREKIINDFQHTREGEVMNFEVQWKKNDGSPVWVLISARRMTDENNHHLCEGFVFDIEPQRKAIQALEESLSQFKATLESSSEGILVVSLEGKILAMNNRFCEIWKIPESLQNEKDDHPVLSYVLKFIDSPDHFLNRVHEIYSNPGKDSFDVLEINDGRVIERYSHPQILDNKPIGRIWSFRDTTEKVRALESLQKSENQYRILFEGANDCIFIMSSDAFISCNEMTLKIFECEDKSDIISHHPWEFSPEFQPDGEYSKLKAKVMIEEALEGKPQRFYWCHITKKGKLIDCEVSLNRIMFDEDVFLQAIVRDISERMKSESVIREKEERFRRIFESSPLGIVLVSSNALFLEVNPVFSRMIGYSEEELRTMTLKSITHPEHLEDDMKGLKKLISDEIPFYMVKKRYITKNGDIIWAQLIVNKIVNSQHQFMYFLGIIEDLSEKIKIENEIKDREFWLSQSQKFARIGTYYLNVPTGNWKCTEVLDEIFGIPSSYPKNIETWASLVYEPDRDYMSNYFRDHIVAHKNSFNTEYRIQRVNDQQVRWVHGRGELTLDENGDILAMMGTISDINERKIMEEELRQAKEKAEESSRLKSSILLNISHELRTPMNSILGYAQILEESIKDQVYKRMADNILMSGNRLKATLDSIVDLSQVQADPKTMRLKNIDIEGIIRNIAYNFKDIAHTKSIQLLLHCQPHLSATADAKLLENALHHLVDNALKFTDQGTVEITAFEDPELNSVVIKVKDTGIGIDKENLQMIFDEFRQVSEGMGRIYEGTGLGLTLCKKFIGLMKGTLSVESEPGSGSVFSIILPLQGSDDLQEISEDEKSGNQTTGVTKPLNDAHPLVLLVEDQEYNLELIEIYLEGICETLAAPDGLTAVTMSSEKQFDAILIDVNLGPGIDGLEATRRIRNIPGYEDIPIIAVTGYTTLAERDHILANGCTHYLSKPYNRVSLVNMVKEVLNL